MLKKKTELKYFRSSHCKRQLLSLELKKQREGFELIEF